MFLEKKLEKNNTLILACILYGVISIVTLPFSSVILNPDGIEYANIPRHYMAGDFFAAINGIWSPLLSWLLLVPQFIGMDPFLFFRLCLIALSLLILWFTNRLLKVFLSKEKYRPLHAAILIFMACFCIYATALTPVTPDLFSVLFIIWFILAIFRYQSKPDFKTAAIIGLIVGIAYYGKNYFLYFGIAASFIFFAYVYLLSKKRRTVLHHFFMCILTTLIVAGAWVGLMSIKYHHITINPIGNYTLSQVGPNYPGAPVLTLGLLEPPYAHSITAREDPSSFEYIPWSPLDSRSDLKYYLIQVIPDNIVHGLQILAPALILLVLGVFSLLHESRKKIVSGLYNFKFIGLIVGSVIYTGGYCLVHIEGGFRYLWPAYIMLGLAFFFLIPHLNKNLRMYMLIIGTVILSLYPIVTNVQSTIGSIKTSREARQLSQDIKKETSIKPGSHIASNEPYAAANICYFNELKCYGLPKRSRVEEQLHVFKINYVFNFKNHTPLPVSGQRIFENKELVILKLSATSDW